MAQKSPNKILEQMFFGSIIHEINQKISGTFDSFSMWLLGGFGATCALLVSQFDTVSKHLSNRALFEVIVLFAISFILAAIQKYSAILIQCGAIGASASRELLEKYEAKEIQLDSEFILSELEKSVFPPGRFFVKRSLNKARKGDLVSGPRNFYRLLQIQGAMVFLQASLMITSVSIIASGFRA